MNKKIRDILLWMVVLPASFLGSIIFTFLYTRFLLIMLGDGWVFLIFGSYFSYLFSGMIFVFIGFSVAPNNKRIASILLTLFVALLYLSYFFIISEYNIEIILSQIVSLLGAIVSTVIFWNEN
ncbi:hypothetical protein M0Q39_03835 [Patescibacteria group bacterium]|nr:hypothetical protein [Patescibacteria group bacterium]